MRWILFLLPLLTLFGQGNGLPQPYEALIREILPSNAKVSVEFYGDTLKGVIKEYTPEGYTRIDITGDDFISFYYELYTTLTGRKPVKVSISVILNGRKLPYNSFLQIWDGVNGVVVLRLSRLQVGCKPPVVEINADTLTGMKVSVPFGEIRKKLFEEGFKYPAYYCY